MPAPVLVGIGSTLAVAGLLALALVSPHLAVVAVVSLTISLVLGFLVGLVFLER